MNTHIAHAKNKKGKKNLRTFFYDNMEYIYQTVDSFNKRSGAFLSKEEIDDVFQNISLKIVQHRYDEKYTSKKSSMKTWLSIICRTVFIDYMRKRKIFLDLEVESIASETPDMTTVLFKIPPNVLSKRQETVLHLAFWEDQQASQIARHLNISPQTVRVIKHQAIQKLRKHLACLQGRSAS